MKSIILIDNGKNFINLRNSIFKTLNTSDNENIEIFDISSTDFKSCLGCFNCWVKTPGLCNNTENNELNSKIVNSDNLIIISELTYGSFSASAKLVIDKIIPNVLPYMSIVNSELRHTKRYKKYPTLLTIAYSEKITPKYKSLFTDTTLAIGHNLHSPKVESFMIDSNFKLDTLNDKINSFIV